MGRIRRTTNVAGLNVSVGVVAGGTAPWLPLDAAMRSAITLAVAVLISRSLSVPDCAARTNRRVSRFRSKALK